MFLLCLPSPQPPYKGGRLPPPPLVDSFGKAASIANIYRRISKYALNMYSDAYIYIYIYIYTIFLWNPYHPNHPIPKYKPALTSKPSLWNAGSGLTATACVLLQCIRTLWIELKAEVSSMDELDMATTRLRVRLPDEPRADPPQANIIERNEVIYFLRTLCYSIGGSGGC